MSDKGKQLKYDTKARGAILAGVEKLSRAVKSTLGPAGRNVVNNAGMEGSLIVEEVKAHKGSYGYNVEKREYGDLVADGVLDPAKVVRCSLQNAASIAGLMLTTECMVTEVPEKKRKPILGSGYERGMDEDY